MNRTRGIRWRSLAVSAVAALVLAARGYCGQTVYDLCIEQSPAQAGRVTPALGTHPFSANSLVPVSAEPQPGYQFAYWLGDVADPKARQTTVHINAPKVIVAVFTRVEEDRIRRVVGSAGGGGGGGDMMSPAIIDLSSPSWSSSGGGTRTRTIISPEINVPEPATALLLTFGVLALRRRSRVG